MATITDTLRTVLEIQGLSAYIQNLQQVQAGSLQAALAHQQLQNNLRGLPRLINQVSQAFGVNLGQWALLAVGANAARTAISAVTQAIREGMQVFDQYSNALTRATILFGNAGRGPQMGQLHQLAQNRLFSLGIAEDRTLGLAGRMAELGYSPGTIRTLLPGLQEISAGTGGRISEDRALTMITRALLSEGGQGALAGRGRGGGRGMMGLASRLGLDVRFLTGDINRDIRYLGDQIREKFGGVAEALAMTPAGVHQRTQELLAAAMGRLGGIVEAALVPAMEMLNQALGGFISVADRLLIPGANTPGQNRLIDTLLGAVSGVAGASPLGFFASGLLGSRHRMQAAENAAGRNRAQHDSDTLDQIAANTRQVATNLATAVFGNASSFSRQALAWSSLNHAMTLRV